MRLTLTLLLFDVFQDSSGITNLTNVARNSLEFMSSVSDTTYGSPSTTSDDIVVLDSFGHSKWTR